MKNISLSILMSFLWLASIAQIPHPIITQALGEMNTDSIFKNLNEFSGEVPCYVYGVQKTIRNRVSNNGNELAGDYLKERLEKMGLTVTDQKYSAKGRNIIAEQKGLVYPDQKYILAGHYDSMADYCADDDASSVCGILQIHHRLRFLGRRGIGFVRKRLLCKTGKSKKRQNKRSC